MKAYIGSRTKQELKDWLQKQADEKKWSLSKYVAEVLQDHHDEIEYEVKPLTKKKQS